MVKNEISQNSSDKKEDKITEDFISNQLMKRISQWLYARTVENQQKTKSWRTMSLDEYFNLLNQ
jgi:hypothetical protein